MYKQKAAVVGLYVKGGEDQEGKKEISLTQCAQKLNEKSNGNLLKAINS